ncbi:hypothetical protein, partial [Lactobacillus crispatus]
TLLIYLIFSALASLALRSQSFRNAWTRCNYFFISISIYLFLFAYFIFILTLIIRVLLFFLLILVQNFSKFFQNNSKNSVLPNFSLKNAKKDVYQIDIVLL